MKNSTLKNSTLINAFAKKFNLIEGLAEEVINVLCNEYNKTVAEIIANIICIETMWNNFRGLYNGTIILLKKEA